MRNKLGLLAAVAGCLIANGQELFFTDFATQSELYDNFTIIDVNEDGNTWRWYAGDIFVHSNDGGRISTDDWLITPGLEMEAGKTYDLEFQVWTENKYDESLEIFMGTSPEISAMTQTIMEKETFRIPSSEKQTRHYSIIPETSGTYYIGWHGCSDPNKHNLHLDNIKISGRASSTPADITDFVAIADDQGYAKALLGFTAPTLTTTGDAISEELTVNLKRDGEVLEAPSVMPGEIWAYLDEGLSNGQHVWTVSVSCSSGSSYEASASDFIGPARPLPPTWVRMEETSTPGTVTLSWSPVELDMNGKHLAPEFITYGISDDGHILEEGISDTSFTIRLQKPDAAQSFRSLEVWAATVADESDVTVSPLYPVGVPYSLPWSESFADANSNSVWVIENMAGSGYCDWQPCPDSAGIPSEDCDNGVVAAFTPYESNTTRLVSGKIEIPQLENPVLQAYYYNLEGGTNQVSLLIREWGEETFQTLITHTNGEPWEWYRMIIPIDEYAGKTIQFALQTTMGNQYYSVFDNLRIFDLPETDVKVGSVTVPTTAKAGDLVAIKTKATNYGQTDVENFEAVLFRDGVEVDTQVIPLLCVYDEVVIEFIDQVTPLFDETTSYRVELRVPGDLNTSDNVSGVTEMTVFLSDYRGPEGLAGAATPNGIELTWTKPSVETDLIPAVTEDFENMTSGTITDFGEWTLYDIDESETYGIENVPFDNMLLPMAFMVFDTDWDGTQTTPELFAAHSGHKFAASMAAYFGPNDDWLISPELNGEAQTVTFYAKSFMNSYREAIEFLYSMDGKETADFVRLGRDTAVPAAWTKYSYDLPEGAKYFAIRCVSDDQFMLMVDDISYSPVGSHGAPLTVLGYNVYRNGSKVAYCEEENYVDSDVVKGDYNYAVTAVYDKGESQPSNLINIRYEGAGVGSLTNQATSVEARNGYLLIAAPAGTAVKVWTVSGLMVTSAIMQDNTLTIPTETPGLYIVKTGSKTHKVLSK